MSDKFISNWFYASLGSYTEEGFFSKKEKYSQRCIDFDNFADKLKKTYEEYDADGYDVVNVTPIQMGQSEASIGKTKQLIPSSNYLGDVGFSITRGAVIIGKKRD